MSSKKRRNRKLNPEWKSAEYELVIPARAIGKSTLYMAMLRQKWEEEDRLAAEERIKKERPKNLGAIEEVELELDTDLDLI